MKKFVLFLFFALFSVLSINAHAVDLKNKTMDVKLNTIMVNDSIINIDKKFKPVYRYLELNGDQYEEFYNIHNDVCQAMVYLENKKSKGVKYFNHHLKYDLMNSSYILDKKQYHKYLKAINVTLQNRGLMNYILESSQD
jgi:hypothetical protein